MGRSVWWKREMGSAVVATVAVVCAGAMVSTGCGGKRTDGRGTGAAGDPDARALGPDAGVSGLDAHAPGPDASAPGPDARPPGKCRVEDGVCVPPDPNTECCRPQGGVPFDFERGCWGDRQETVVCGTRIPGDVTACGVAPAFQCYLRMLPDGGKQAWYSGDIWNAEPPFEVSECPPEIRDAPKCGAVTKPDGGRTFCEELAAGAVFSSTKLLWCSTGWGGDGAVPTPEQAPDLYCHWRLEFGGTTVTWTEEDTAPSSSYVCSGNVVTAFDFARGIWDPEREVLTFEGDEYRRTKE